MLPGQPPRRGGKSSSARSRPWQNCTCSIRRDRLGDFGKPGNYFARQVDRWTKQYRASETQHIPEVEKRSSGCRRPCRNRSVSPSFTALSLDNMIFHATEPRVQAVLDWNWSTLGDPIGDFTYLLMQYDHAGPGRRRSQGLNIPSMMRPRKSMQRHRAPRARPELVFSYICSPCRHHARHCRADPATHRGEPKAWNRPSARCRCRSILEYARRGRRGLHRV